MPAPYQELERYLKLPALSRSTGDLTFDGDIEIEGNVKDDVRLTATGSILVKGNVLGASILAGGEVSVRGAVCSHSMVRGGGDVFLRSAERSSIEGAREVFVAANAEFCQLRVGQTLHVSGSIVGGKCHVDEAVVVGGLGARSGVRTEIVMDPARRRAEEISRLERDLDTVRSNLMFLRGVDSFERVGGGRTGLVKFAHRVPPTEETLAAEFRAALKALVIARTRGLDKPGPRIDVSLGLYPGVDLLINGARLSVRSLLPPGILQERNGRIHTLVDTRPACRSF